MMPRLMAERQLAAIEAAAVPQLDAADQKRIIGTYQRRLGGNEGQARSAAEALSRLPLTRVQEPKKG